MKFRALNYDYHAEAILRTWEEQENHPSQCIVLLSSVEIDKEEETISSSSSQKTKSNEPPTLDASIHDTKEQVLLLEEIHPEVSDSMRSAKEFFSANVILLHTSQCNDDRSRAASSATATRRMRLETN
jgi:hypothetical protein